MDPFDDPFAAAMEDPLTAMKQPNAHAHASAAPSGRKQDFGDDPFGFGSGESALLSADPFGDGFGAPAIATSSISSQAAHQIAAEFVAPDGFGDEEEDNAMDDFELLDQEQGSATLATLAGSVQRSTPSTGLKQPVVTPSRPSVADEVWTPAAAPEFGSPEFEAAPMAMQLRMAVDAGLLPSNTTLAEYVSLRGGSAPSASSAPPSYSSAHPKNTPLVGGSFFDDFVGGTGSFDAESQKLEAQFMASQVGGGTLEVIAEDQAAIAIQSAARGYLARATSKSAKKALEVANDAAHKQMQAQADAAAARIQAAARGRMTRISMRESPLISAASFISAGASAPLAADEMTFDSFDTTPAAAASVLSSNETDDFRPVTHSSQPTKSSVAIIQSAASDFDDFDFDRPTTSAKAVVPVVAPVPVPARKAAPVPIPAQQQQDSFGFDDFDTPAPASAKPAAPAPASTAVAATVIANIPTNKTSAVALNDFGFDADFASIPVPSQIVSSFQVTTTTGSSSSRPPVPVATQGSTSTGESFEDFGFGLGSPPRPTAKVEAHVSLSAVATETRGGTPVAAAPAMPTVLSADAAANLLSRPPLAIPGPASLASASITGLTVEWAVVPGADAYYVDFETRSRVGTDESTAGHGAWTGAGSRAVAQGSPAIRATTASIPGLMKDAVYVVRITALRVLPVKLPNGAMINAVEESAPGPVSAHMRTLNPGAEIARLTADNFALAAKVATIPGINTRLASTEADLASTYQHLAAAKAEIVRLTAVLNGKISELNAANADIARIQGLVLERDATIAHETSEVLRLTGELVDTVEDLDARKKDIASLHTAIGGKDADLHAAAERETAAAMALAAKDAEIASVKSKLGDAEAHLRSEKSARADLASKYDKAAGQLSSVGTDKDAIIAKLSEDIGTVMEELNRVQKQLHTAQDYVAFIQPAADVVLDIRKRQAAWEDEQALIQSGNHPVVGSRQLAKMGAVRKLGPRPTLTL